MADRQGARQLVGKGLLVAAGGLTLVALAAPGKEMLLLLPGLLLFGVSRPFVFTPASTGPMKALPPSERGFASSLVSESRQMGAILGVAAFGAITAAFEVHARTGATAAGIEAAMLVAAAACLTAGTVVLATFPKRREPSRQADATSTDAHRAPDRTRDD